MPCLRFFNFISSHLFIGSTLGLQLSINIHTKILVCLHAPKKSAVLACLTMAKLKMKRRVPNKNADLLKKNQLNGNRAEYRNKFYKLDEN